MVDLLEFKEIGKDPQNLSIEQITEIITEQKEKIDFYFRKRNYI